MSGVAQLDADTCPECSGPVEAEDRERVCAECGLVVGEDRLDRGPEWSNHTPEDNNARCGPPNSECRHDAGISSEIHWRDEDANGNRLSDRKSRQMGRLRKMDARASFESKADKNLADAFGEIRRLTGSLGLSHSDRELASRLWRTAQDGNLILGRSIEGMASAAVYAALRCGPSTRSIEQVAAVAQVDKARIRTCYNVLNRELGLPAEIQRPSEYVGLVAAEVDAPAEVRRRARSVVELAESEISTCGTDPAGWAAAAIWLIGQDGGWWTNQTEPAEAAGVTEVTLRERVDDLRSLDAEQQ